MMLTDPGDRLIWCARYAARMRQPGTSDRPEPPPVPAARRRDGSDGLEHAQPGSDWPTLCGIPAGEVDLYRHLFTASDPADCPRCAELIWRLEPTDRPPGPFASLVWLGDQPAMRLHVRANSSAEAEERLRMRFGESSVISVWAEEATARVQGTDFASEPARLAAADQVIVFTGAGFDAKKRRSNERLAVEYSSPAIAELAGLLTDFRPGEAADWMEWPAVSIAFLERRRLIAEFGLLSGLRWVRTPTASDREIRDPERLHAWLADRGVDRG